MQALRCYSIAILCIFFFQLVRIAAPLAPKAVLAALELKPNPRSCRQGSNLFYMVNNNKLWVGSACSGTYAH